MTAFKRLLKTESENYVMGKKLVRKALEMIRKMAQKAEEAAAEAAAAKEEEDAAAAAEEEDAKEDAKEEEEDDYTKFWKAFGKNIKLFTADFGRRHLHCPLASIHQTRIPYDSAQLFKLGA